MPRNSPTQAHTSILQLLSAFEYLTTREVCEYLEVPTTKRAVEQKLNLLEQKGFIQSGLLNHERGAASQRYWFLLEKGSETLGMPHETREVVAGSTVTPRQIAVLKLLAEMKHLSTAQIRGQLHIGKSKLYTWQLLRLLQQRGYIKGQRLHPELGTSSEYYWILRKRGADAIGCKYSRGYLRRPSRRAIEHRGLLLEMARQTEEAGWTLLKPVPPSSIRHGDHKTPQRQQLLEAVLKREELTIRRLVEQGYPVSRLQERIKHLRAGHVGAVVPRMVNDYVAHVPDEPERTVLLIPHPPWAGRAFWTRRPGVRPRPGGKRAGPQDSPSARINKYARLSQVLPVIAVFSSEEVAGQYSGLLAAEGLAWAPVLEITNKLLEIMVRT